MGFKNDSQFFKNLPVSDKMIISSGPIIVYRTAGCDIENFRDKFEIIHGWSPLLMSTAKCFTRLIISNITDPVCIPIIRSLTVNAGVNVQLYTSTPTKPVIQENENCIVSQRKVGTDDCPDVSTAVANVFLADMNSFNETVDLRINTDATIFNERIDSIVMKAGSSITINRIIQTSGGATSTIANS
ncbi:hypothetical protein GCK72_009900 [Caenorhabditis remanei]|uniref:Uncharacterized protein n=1 Tax=Caenorhabditis remanei TaxID=31234 RepID=A0A6A5H4H2_CAERE|nr:hypothetical protein GCK72_009900 [Caenorhabditis remanei]KAF1761644.1 hypothetical protein GCK72_009900 [Caenorhabditis remanei]